MTTSTKRPITDAPDWIIEAARRPQGARRDAGGRGPLGRFQLSGELDGGPEADAVEERPPAEPHVLADHRKRIAAIPPYVLGVFGLDLDVEIALRSLIRRNRQGVLSVGVGAMLRLAQDGPRFECRPRGRE